MAYISTYGNQLFLNSVFTRDTTAYPLPTNFSLALLTDIPDKNTPLANLSEVISTVAGSTNVVSGTYYEGTKAGLTGGTYLNYFLSSPMSYAFADGQQVTVSGTGNSDYNVTGIIANTLLTNTNTIAAWSASPTVYAAGDVVTYNNAYYKNLTGTNGTAGNTPFSDTTRWQYLPVCDYLHFTVFVPSTVSTTFSAASGTVVGNTGYSRKVMPANSSNWTNGQGSVFNKNNIIWDAAYLNWGNVVAWALLDDSATPNVIASGGLQQNLLVKQNTIVNLSAGSLRLFIN